MNLSSSKALRIGGVLAAGYILFRAIEEFYKSAPGSGPWLGRFSTNWGIIFAGLLIFCVLVLAGVILALWIPGKTERVGQAIIRLRQRLNWLRWPIAVVFVSFPAYFLLYTDWGSIFTSPYLRLLLLLVTSVSFAVLTTSSGTDLAQRTNLFLGIVMVGSIFAIGERLTNVTNFPFSLTWSEGNRLYDYSIYVDSDRYTYPGGLKIPYGAAGRYILWGILFTIPNTPIWLHRLWDAILWTVPHLILGYLLARGSKLNKSAKWVFTLWAFIFLVQGPIYTPLILSALLIVLLVRPDKWLLSLIGAALAGFYASASRWTWLPAPTAWAALILISGFKIGKKEPKIEVVRRLVPIAIVITAGLIGGMLANAKLFSPAQVSSSTALSQPLLWTRLLPNATYHQGILWGLTLATVPLIILLFWLALSKRWPINWLQALAYVGAPLIFLTMGIVASVKIGGGSNLHNLDMFLVTLAMLAALMLQHSTALSPEKWPPWAQAVLVLMLLLPSWNAVQTGKPLQLPSQANINEALDTIATKVAKAQRRGEVLFIDQRQLLTFGYIQGIPLIPDYEKKDMMDRAMASNADYFQEFYQDLADQRFALIVTEPLFLNEQDMTYSFEEENNAWVSWVARPLLCYYAPIATMGDVHVQLLVPRNNPENCP